MKAPKLFIALITLIIFSVQGLSQNAAEENTLLQHITVMEKGLLLLSKYQDANIQNPRQSRVESFVMNEQAFIAQTTIHQIGWHNMIFLQQSTSGGSITVTQTGQANQYEGKITGNEVKILITQQGELNMIDQSITGEQLEFTIYQEGNRNFIQQRADRSVIPLQIQQTGNDMRLIIKSGF